MVKKQDLIFDLKRLRGSAPKTPKLAPRMYAGELLPKQNWPRGHNPILYFYFWLPRNAITRPTVFKPDDLFYTGERQCAKNFRRGWLPPGTRGKESRYPWLPKAQNRRIYAVAYELPSHSSYDEPDKRRSIEYFVARDLIDRYGMTTNIFKFTGRFDFRVGWLRATDLRTYANEIINDLKISFGV